MGNTREILGTQRVVANRTYVTWAPATFLEFQSKPEVVAVVRRTANADNVAAMSAHLH